MLLQKYFFFFFLAFMSFFQFSDLCNVLSFVVTKGSNKYNIVILAISWGGSWVSLGGELSCLGGGGGGGKASLHLHPLPP